MNINPLYTTLAFGAGLALGAFYFGLLWLTVRKIGTAKNPAGLMLVSFVLRLGAVLAGFYFVMDGRWERLVACLIGFIIMRSLFAFRLRPGVGGQVEG
ncbi:MAG: N-ATPase subunit AtpR [Planctomycetota bacterium]|jgi:F1F0 ATPase subunit 2